MSSSSNCLTTSLLQAAGPAALRLAGLETSAGVGEKLGILDGDGDCRSNGMLDYSARLAMVETEQAAWRC